MGSCGSRGGWRIVFKLLGELGEGCLDFLQHAPFAHTLQIVDLVFEVVLIARQFGRQAGKLHDHHTADGAEPEPEQHHDQHDGWRVAEPPAVQRCHDRLQQKGQHERQREGNQDCFGPIERRNHQDDTRHDAQKRYQVDLR